MAAITRRRARTSSGSAWATPKQDLWMHRLAPDLGGVLAMGVGAAFDFISGNRRAPPCGCRSRASNGCTGWCTTRSSSHRATPRRTRCSSQHHRRGHPRHGRGSPPVPVMPCACWSSTTGTAAPSRAARTRSSTRRSSSCASAGVDVSTCSRSRATRSPAGPPPRRRRCPPGWSGRATGARTVRRAIAGFRPDVVHFHNTFPLLSPAALRAAHGAGVRVVQTLHNFRPLCPAGMFLRDGQGLRGLPGPRPAPGGRPRLLPVIAAGDAPDRRQGRRCTARSAPGRHGGRHLHHAVRVRPQPLPEGGMAGRADRRQVQHGARPRHPPAGLRAAGFVCLSRLAPEKGIDVLLDAWGRTFPDGGARLRIVGSRRAGDRAAGSRGDADRRRARRPAPARRGRSRSSPERARSSSRRAGTRCSRGSSPRPTRSGVPVHRLAARQPRGDRRRRQDGPALRAPTTPADLGRALRALADDRGLAERLGEGARREYEQHLSPGATTDRLLEIYSGAPPRVTAAGSAPLTAGGAAL